MSATPENIYDPNTMPLEQINVSDPRLFQNDTVGEYFARLRRDEPVHYCSESEYGPFWSVTKYDDIVSVDTNHKVFSSDHHRGGIGLPYNNLFGKDNNNGIDMQMFIAMDPPNHTEKRKTISPITSPATIATLEGTIRTCVTDILDSLPIGETFDWVDKYSMELTSQVLSKLFDIPFEKRRQLTIWSDAVMSEPGHEIDSWEERTRRMNETGVMEMMVEAYQRKLNEEPNMDLLSLLAHSPATKDMDVFEFAGNMALLIIGGNDTTRNSLSGGVLALNQFPEEYEKLCNDQTLIESMVPEIIRYQTPLACMSRTALADSKIRGKTIKEGETVVMWYLSGNRDEEAIDRADDFIIDRENPRRHLSFGFGIHRCAGMRLAEMQLRITWEEVLKRFEKVEVVGEAVRNRSCVIHGIKKLPVTLLPIS